MAWLQLASIYLSCRVCVMHPFKSALTAQHSTALHGIYGFPLV